MYFILKFKIYFSEKYRDLIDAADTISSMAMIIKEISDVTESILKTNHLNSNVASDRYYYICDYNFKTF